MYADDLSVQIIRKDSAPVNGLVHSHLFIVTLSMIVVKRTYYLLLCLNSNKTQSLECRAYV